MRKLEREKAQLLAKISELELRYNYGTEKTAFCLVLKNNFLVFSKRLKKLNLPRQAWDRHKQGKLSKCSV